MIDKVIYEIAVEESEYGCTHGKEWFDSFEDALNSRMKYANLNSRMKYANWYRPRGSVWIRKYKGSPIVSEEWLINPDGTIESYYDWDRLRSKNK